MQSSIFTNIIHRVREKAKNTRAQAMLEVGLLMPLAIMIMLGSFDIVKVCTTYLDMNAALTEGMAYLMVDGEGGAQYKAINTMQRSFAENSFFKTDGLEITHLGPYPPGAMNTIGTVWCVDGEVQLDVFYKELFGKNSATIRKRVCSLQEVSLIR